jgi:CRISPR-associated protein Cas2
MDEHLHLVTYDIRDDSRSRRIFKLMKGYGEWLQL